MSIQKTNEFSVCLVPTSETTDAVNAVRKQLTPSPYRDDSPHITLARGIVSDAPLTDAELVKKVADVTNIDKKLPLTGVISDAINKQNEFYNTSALLIVSPSDELEQFRKDLLELLDANGFIDESQDKNVHVLHITIRLGVKLEGDVLADMKKQFLNKRVTFNNWWLFRLELANNARKMHKVSQ